MGTLCRGAPRPATKHEPGYGLRRDYLSYQHLVAGAKAAFMVAGTAAAVGVALANDRRLTPALVEASPSPPPRHTGLARSSNPVAVFPRLPEGARAFLARRFGVATLLAIAGILLAASLPAITALATDSQSSPAMQSTLGPPSELRAASGVTGNWERSYSMSVPPVSAIGAIAIAAAAEQLKFEEGIRAMGVLRDAEAAKAAAAATQASSARTAPRASVGGPAYSANRASGYAIGTILAARVTVYGCTGPGGGFCGNMASGVRVFEGAAACSPDLPFGTKIRIIGDPTGRIYECLDRGALKTTWVDVFFNDTSAGIAWAGLLGGTTANIEIVN